MRTIKLIICVACCMYTVIAQRDRTDLPKDLTFDQIILRAMGGSNKIAASLTLPDPDKKLAELDMMLTNKQYEALYGNKTGNRSKRKATSDASVYWPSGRVPYKFAPNHFSAYEQWMIKVAMREWEKYTCVRFHEAGSTDTNYVYFQDGLGCNSQLGMVGGRQALNLDKSGCRFKGLYLHEIAHALGVVHEHQRPIRDDYITIVYENVEPAMRIWFQKYNPNAISGHNVQYEYSSVMHYGVKAFSGNNLQTIRAKQAAREDEIGRVYAKELSFTDVEIVNRMYQCVRTSQECEGKVCEGRGYLDQNCNCICPDGSRDCERGTTRDNSCNNNARTDRENWQCYIWARQGECEANARFMSSNCARACGQCGNERKDLPDSQNLCVNIYDDDVCKKWKDEVGDCRVAEHFMKVFCKKSCGYCDDYNLNRTPLLTQCANAYTNDTACERWARQGECIINPRWMPLNCRKACFTCEVNDRGQETTPPFSTPINPGSTTRSSRTTRPTIRTTRRPTTRPPTITTQITTKRPVEDCVNRYPDKDCDVWAKYDHCKINPLFMEANCMRSCKVCTDTSTGNTGGGGGGGNGGTDDLNCVNKNSDCQVWADHQHCVINPGYMLKYCMKSCRSCTAGLKQAAQQVIASYENGGTTACGSVLSLFFMLFILILIN